jgi:predicted Zn-dependent protease
MFVKKTKYIVLALVFCLISTNFVFAEVTDQNKKKEQKVNLLEYSYKDIQLLQSVLKDLQPYTKRNANYYKIQIKKSKQFNAFVSYGKNLVVHSSVFRTLKSRVAIAMIIAHEVGHLERKHLIKGTVLQIFTMLGITTASIFTNSQILGSIYGQAGSGIVSTHSRSQERNADLFAVDVVNKLYCDEPGKLEAWMKMIELDANNQHPLYARSHPYASDRYRYMRRIIEDAGCAL